MRDSTTPYSFARQVNDLTIFLALTNPCFMSTTLDRRTQSVPIQIHVPVQLLQLKPLSVPAFTPGFREVLHERIRSPKTRQQRNLTSTLSSYSARFARLWETQSPALRCNDPSQEEHLQSHMHKTKLRLPLQIPLAISSPPHPLPPLGGIKSTTWAVSPRARLLALGIPQDSPLGTRGPHPAAAASRRKTTVMHDIEQPSQDQCPAHADAQRCV